MKIQFFIIRVSIAQPGFLGKTRLRRARPLLAAMRYGNKKGPEHRPKDIFW